MSARKILDGAPVVPDCLSYLLDWLDMLHGRSGIGMTGIVPLTYTTIADWSRLTGTAVAPHEVHALLVLDAVRCHPGTPGTVD